MGSQEINILEFELDDCKGDIRKLQASWEQVPLMPEGIMKESKGYSADEVDVSIAIAQRVSNAFDTLLKNSAEFLEQAGIKFGESDEKANCKIKSLTQGV